MFSSREVSFPPDPAWPGGGDLFTTTSPGLGVTGPDDNPRQVFCRGLPDHRVPAPAAGPDFGRLPPWAQPVWIRPFPG